MPVYGLFGGSFNPVHRGHIRLALIARKALGLDQVWMVPCALSADGKPLADGKLRLAWLRKSVRGIPGLKVWDGELKRGGISRTVDTLRALKELKPNASWTLLIGADQAKHLGTWKQAKSLPGLAAIAAFRRPGVSAKAASGFSVTWVPAPAIDLSSSLIRQRLAKGLGAARLLPAVLAADPRLAAEYHTETRYLPAIPGMTSSIRQGLKLPLSKTVSKLPW
ncbi:MAG TPA: nicotinate (nicotinamide) nucleotide adenylyltransferase [bacterium]|jgi:nicotinate-nucleotide adenylyltransferase|nr:nicotinate (nicotinamide) nucleotide adenylyltransferase [bacterium]